MNRTYGDVVAPPPEKKRVLGLVDGDNLPIFETRGVFVSKPPTTDRRDYICWSHATLKHFVVYDGRLRVQHDNIQHKAGTLAAVSPTGELPTIGSAPHNISHHSGSDVILKTFSNSSSQSRHQDDRGPEVQQVNSKSSHESAPVGIMKNTNAVPSYSYL